LRGFERCRPIATTTAYLRISTVEFVAFPPAPHYARVSLADHFPTMYSRLSPANTDRGKATHQIGNQSIAGSGQCDQPESTQVGEYSRWPESSYEMYPILRTNLTTRFEKLTRLRRAYLTICAPFHADRTPRLYNPETSKL
jgi:hypothetical protein